MKSYNVSNKKTNLLINFIVREKHCKMTSAVDLLRTCYTCQVLFLGNNGIMNYFLRSEQSK